MGKTVKSVSKAVNNFSKSTVGKVVAPMFTLPAQAIQKATGLSPAAQLGAGAAIGTGLGALSAAGALGGANAALAGTGAAGAGAVSGTTAALGQGGAGVLAQSGGVPLLTKVLLGTSVATTLASYFGRKPGQDYSDFINGLDDESRAEIGKLEANLTEIQNNLQVRDQAVQKVIDDYPNIVAQVHAERAKAGEEFDSVTKQVMDQVSNQLSAKYAATGGFNSGAFNQGLANKAGDIAFDKLNYMGNREGAAWQQQMTGYNARLAEVESLRDFQRSMLGQGVQDRFSATQNYLANAQNNRRAIAGLKQNQDMANQQATTQLFGSLGSTLGTAAMLPMYQQMFNPNKAAAVQTNQMGAPVSFSDYNSAGGVMPYNTPKLRYPGYGGGF